MRAYFLCKQCSARSPRVSHEFIDVIHNIPSNRNMVPKTLALIEELAYDAATKPFDIETYSITDEEMDEIFKLSENL